MIVLKSISMERIWGTPRLHEYNGNKTIDKIGSIYTVSGTKEIDTIAVNGAYKGQTLNQLVTADPALFGLQKGEVFPLIVSMTSADEDLSIQVHPTDSYAQMKYGVNYGKSESWYFIEAPENGWIFANAFDKEKAEIQEEIETKQFLNVVQKTAVQPEDLVYIPAGTIHALTKGSLVYEVQQSTDITYRFYDYDRVDSSGQRRELHLDDALAVIDTTKCVEKNDFSLGKTVSKQAYDLTHLILRNEYNNERNVAVVVTVIDGRIESEGFAINKGQSVILFPNERIILQGEAEVIVAKPNTYWRGVH